MTDSTHYVGDSCPGGHSDAPRSLVYYDCCRHCGDDCGAKDHHRFPCNACQTRVKDKP